MAGTLLEQPIRQTKKLGIKLPKLSQLFITIVIIIITVQIHAGCESD